jgi:hypothetical protein
MIDRADRHIRQARKALGQEAQGHALPGARIAMNHREAALANQCVLDAPAEVLNSGRYEDGLGCSGLIPPDTPIGVKHLGSGDHDKAIQTTNL